MSDCSTAADFLARAKAVYSASIVNYRDALLETGRLLHEYVLAYLSEGGGACRDSRATMGITREKAVARAAAEFGVKPLRIRNLIIVSMTVSLIGRDVDLGSLGHNALRYFGYFVRRGYVGRTGLDATSVEEWFIREGFEEKAQALLRRAVAEGFTQDKTRIECVRIFGGRKTAKPRRSIKTKKPFEQLACAASKAAPRDVAEACVELVEKAEEPEAVVAHLRTMLTDLLERLTTRNRRSYAS